MKLNRKFIVNSFVVCLNNEYQVHKLKKKGTEIFDLPPLVIHPWLYMIQTLVSLLVK